MNNFDANKKRLRSEVHPRDENTEKGRKVHQKKLLDEKQQELLERLNSGNFIKYKKTSKNQSLEKLEAYKSKADFPKDLKKNQIYVDMRNYAVILPFHGMHVPYHISVIKNVSKIEEGKTTSLRINFHIPGGASNLSNLVFQDKQSQPNQPNAVYIRELTFMSSNGRSLVEAFKKIKDLQKKVKEKDQEDKDKEDIVAQENLILLKGKRPVLQDLKIRPNISGKKSHGTLEGHANGLRYQTNKNERIDITFSNVKHAFYQPCEGEMIILLHFHLHHPIMVGKKKTHDVQFYTEAGIQAEDLDFRRRPQTEMDEYEQEEKERALRKKLNQEFEQFVRAIEQTAKDQVQFDIPYRELGFYGSPNRSNVLLLPTVNCLVNLTDTPFFILSLDEVEIVHFERVQYGLKNFDLTFVFKDYSRQVVRVNAIPVEYIEQIKNWLDKIDLIFSESRINIHWTNVMNTIKKDPQAFVEDGGWNFLQESENEGEERDDSLGEDDSAFTVEEEEDEDAESESEYSDDEEEEESDFDGEDDEDVDEGDDWDEEEDDADDERRDRKKPPVNKKKEEPKKRVKKDQAEIWIVAQICVQ
eukprot:TRINITY_DN1794_c0_g1_i3.p1 TRINITY_DN1794_c0_g1~~TRINITY_DN1794_c0_g1_i3.p1  ORF type:complete len:584 (-),score=203.87 TRINITY_DN1794_c0_g1_i3:211-1962(-)